MCKGAGFLRRATSREKPPETMPCPQCNWAVYLRAAQMPYIEQDASGQWIYPDGEIDPANFADPFTLLRLAEYEAAIVERIAEGRGMLLYSAMNGSGKTRMAVQIGAAAAISGYRVVFTTPGKLWNAMRDAYAAKEPERATIVFDRALGADLLILDDLAAHSATKFTEDRLFDLLDERLYQRRATIITTNESLATLGAAISSGNPLMGNRIVSRLADLCDFVEVKAHRDYRLVRAERRTA